MYSRASALLLLLLKLVISVLEMASNKRTDENGDEYILDEVKLTGSVVEEVRIVPVGNKFTLEGD